MPRHHRIVEAGLPHHVIIRGNNRRRLFSYANCYLRFLRYVGDALVRHPCSMNALVLMANHVHMIVTPAESEALGAFVKSFSQRYAVMRNRERRSSGKLFEERFKSSIIRDDMHLATVTAYIEMNPVRAGICANPDEFAWSTYRLHADGQLTSKIPADLWTPSPWYDSLGDTDLERRRGYCTWMSAYRQRLDPPRESEPLREPVAQEYALQVEGPDRSVAREESLWMAYSRLPSRRP